MIISIVIAILIVWVILNFPELIGGLLFLAFVVIGGIAAIVVAVLVFKNADPDTFITIGLVVGGVLIVGLVFNGLGRIFNGISNLWNKFYDLKTILKFLSIQFFTSGITDKQKINKIKQINKLVIYGKENHQLAKDRREEREKQEEIEKFDNHFLECKKAYNKFSDLINTELLEYINSDYISLEFVEPTRETIYGKIVINANDANSIIKIGVSKDGFRVNEYFSDRGDFESETARIYYEEALTRVKVTAKTTKRLLRSYYKLHPEKLGI